MAEAGIGKHGRGESVKKAAKPMCVNQTAGNYNAANKIQKAVETKRKWGYKCAMELLSTIEKHNGTNVYSLAKLMKWSIGNVTYFVNRLEKLNLVKSVYEVKLGRMTRRIYRTHPLENIILTDEDKAFLQGLGLGAKNLPQKRKEHEPLTC